MDFNESDEDSGLTAIERGYALHDAAESGDENLVEGILANAVRDVEFVPEAPNERSEIDHLDLDELDDSSCSPLHIALLKGHLEVVQLLVLRGASVSLLCEGSPPLVVAVCSSAHPKRRDRATACVKILLDGGASPYQRDDNGATALHWAAWLGECEIMKLLLAAAELHKERHTAQLREDVATATAAGGPLPDIKPLTDLESLQDKQGNTALHMAASTSHSEAVSLLLDSPEARKLASITNKAQQTPLHFAAMHGHAEAARKLLLLHPKAAKGSDRLGRTPLEWATLFGHEALALLFKKQAGGAELAGLHLEPRSEQQLPTLIVAPHACREHRTAREPLVRGQDIPPENVRRLHVLTDPEDGILRTAEFAALSWDEQDRFSPLADILKIHEWKYVKRIQGTCGALADDPSAIGHIDADTTLSRRTWQAALAGVGACCHAIDQVMAGKAQNAFCAIRPPGHHAGPLGAVSSANDPQGSQGFCFFNNIAVAGAYAVNVYRHRGIQRVALLDFDVHHGNGTQACIARVVPHVLQSSLQTPLSDGTMSFPGFHPWIDESDKDSILFASVQGYGKRHGVGGFIYPGSGATCDTMPAPASVPSPELPSAAPDTEAVPEAAVLPPDPNDGFGSVPPDSADLEFATVEGEHPSTSGPRVINVGISGPGSKIGLWQRAWRDKILPQVAAFKPDLIIVSAGFDAHKKDHLNNGFIGVTEREYYWLTRELVSLANTVCSGRLVTALEGGYRIQGGIVSAFSRSVAAHVRALHEFNGQAWNEEEGKRLRALELQRRREQLAAKRAMALKAIELAAEKARLELVQAAASAAAASAADPVAAQPQAAADVASPLDPATAAAVSLGIPAEAAAAADQGRKRRRGPVDYTALNLQLQLEEEAKRGKSNVTVG